LDIFLMHPEGYHTYWNSAVRPGYSGVALFTRERPLKVTNGFGIKRFDDEGRVITAEYPEFAFLTVYFPNGKASDERLRYKMDFYEETLEFVRKLKKKQPNIIVCGDYNTAHKPIDLARPKENEDVSGFLPVERAWLDKWVADGQIDVFRKFHEGPGHYSWWDLKSGARERNVGWRIDYHFVTETLVPKVKSATILKDVAGSDHAPVEIQLK
ncbi:MAG TPA: exodeoxyribonuclease III, partial [Candidatus Omnitrophota bacterium]|nr:exodeoxyribonuclease III [Candidatus Omnitrophota bacterium]